MNQRFSLPLIFSFLIVHFFFPAFAFSATPLSGQLKVVCTTGMISNVVEEVGGELVNVTGLMGAGVDPHLYKPTRSDIAALNSADLVFYNGLLLEGKMTDALIRIATSGKKVVAVTEQLAPEYLLEPPGFAGHFDPHVWMDPRAWMKTVEVIRDSLIALLPSHKDTLLKNAEGYLKKLTELDSYAERVLKSVPASSRVLVTAHDAFNYFGRRYGFEVLGIQGISTESEAGEQDIERIVKILVERKISAVFIESTVSDRNIKALVEGAAAKGQQVQIGGQLFSDAMGSAGTYEGSYLGMIDHNVTLISRALGGNAEIAGWSGKLSSSAK